MEFLFFIVVLLVLLLIIFQFVLASLKGKWSLVDKKFCSDSWKKIIHEKDLRHQIMDADKLLNVMLRKRGHMGSLGEILKEEAALFTDINGLWSAHKMRNKLAHELNFDVTSYEAKIALRSFEKALKDIGLSL